MPAYTVVYQFEAVDRVWTTTVYADDLDKAEAITVRQLKGKAGTGKWYYEIYPIPGRRVGEVDTRKKP